jgi:hypothetical protein
MLRACSWFREVRVFTVAYAARLGSLGAVADLRGERVLLSRWCPRLAGCVVFFGAFF